MAVIREETPVPKMFPSFLERFRAEFQGSDYWDCGLDRQETTVAHSVACWVLNTSSSALELHGLKSLSCLGLSFLTCKMGAVIIPPRWESRSLCSQGLGGVVHHCLPGAQHLVWPAIGFQ